MRVAITLSQKPERECYKNKRHYSFFSRSKAESLPRLSQSGAPAYCNHERILTDTDQVRENVLTS